MITSQLVTEWMPCRTVFTKTTAPMNINWRNRSVWCIIPMFVAKYMSGIVTQSLMSTSEKRSRTCDPSDQSLMPVGFSKCCSCQTKVWIEHKYNEIWQKIESMKYHTFCIHVVQSWIWKTVTTFLIKTTKFETHLYLQGQYGTVWKTLTTRVQILFRNTLLSTNKNYIENGIVNDKCLC